MHADPDAGLFPALLKHWRGQRGLSQLDLAIAADVSSRHVSFLETGRSTPSPAMVRRLAATLDVPLRHVNAMLEAAGHERAFPEPSALDGLPPSTARAIELLARHHEPYPLVVLDRTYDVIEMNWGGAALLRALLGDDYALGDDAAPLNLARATFDPAGAQPAIANFPEVGRELLWRIQREVLAEPDRGPLRALLDELLAMPTVSPDWRDVDLGMPSPPSLEVHLRTVVGELRFVTVVTAFQAPQDVLVDELRVETWLPVDHATAAACEAVVTRATASS